MEVAADEEVTTFDASFGDQAREWLATVYAAMERMPAGKLFSLLRPSTTVMYISATALVVCCTGGVTQLQLPENFLLYAGSACQPSESIC